MDQLNNLDPKLKETYERVMGTSVNASAGTQPTPAASTTPATPPPPPPMPTAAQPQTPAAPAMPTAALSDQNAQAAQPAAPAGNTNFAASNPSAIPGQGLAAAGATVANATVTPAKRSSGMMPILFIFGGVVFFAIYAIFWMKFFNLPGLPF